jgi:hypothetical protein
MGLPRNDVSAALFSESTSGFLHGFLFVTEVWVKPPATASCRSRPGADGIPGAIPTGRRDFARAFSSEVEPGSRQENATIRNPERRFDSIETEKALA